MFRWSFAFLAIVLVAVVLCDTGCIRRSNGESTFITKTTEQPSGGYSGPMYRPNRLERPATTVEGMCGDCRVSGGTCAACAKMGLDGLHYCDHCREASIFCDPCRKAGD